MALDKVVDSTELDAGLTRIAEAIREKFGTSEKLSFPDGMESAVRSFQPNEDWIISRSILGAYENDRVTFVGDRAFCNCYNLETAELPNVDSVGAGAFESCFSLKYVNCPKASMLGRSAFFGCSALQEANFPLLQTISPYAFYLCESLQTISFPTASGIGGLAFTGCSSLQHVVFPEVISVGNAAFESCTLLSVADFYKVESFGDHAFFASGLSKLILRSSKKVTFEGTSVLADTPIANGTGNIYVPASLLDSYKADSVWSTYANQFRALEDYTVDGTTTGELDESKI